MKANVKSYIEDRFETVKLLRQTTKGTVHLAQARDTGELVIIKHVNLTGLPYKILRKNFNPLFAKILICAEDVSDTVIVEEFIQGESLIERLNHKNFLSEDEAQKILLQLCDGLKFLHGLGIIHRDIKPSNLILQAGGIVRLIDFDAARIVKPNQHEDTNALGTKGYAPPEQYGYGQTDARSDIYSLGVTMQKLLGENYHGRLKNILAKCTEIDPKNRWQNVDELKSALLHKESFAAKIFSSRVKFMLIGILICAVTFLAYKIFLTNQVELPTVENSPQVEEPPIVESPTYTTPPVEKFNADEKFSFPEIIIPPTQNPPAHIDVKPLPNLDVKPPRVESPPQVESDYVMPQPFQKENSMANVNYVKAEYYLDGERLHAWTDTFDVNFANVDPAESYNFSYDYWNSWEKVPNSTAIIFPPSVIEVFVKNFSSNTLTNSQLEITFTNDGRTEKKILRGDDIAPNQTKIFTVPLNQFRIDNPHYKLANATFDSIVLNFSGDGAEIRGTNAKVSFYFIQP